MIKADTSPHRKEGEGAGKKVGDLYFQSLKKKQNKKKKKKINLQDKLYSNLPAFKSNLNSIYDSTRNKNLYAT